ncbi:transglycosylase SLT domain-containing protein [Streptomyces sp. NPDC058249]|uniref:transglycosylase SLT domain-containing protein n=1 Tax=Streptomyces sp. NPDC058249 TaxID=3346403 RepID=UPI0036E36536
MAGDLDIVGGAAVDVVPIVPNFHRDLKTAVLPIADKVGAEAGRKLGERMVETMRASLAGDGQRIGNDLGDAIGDAMARRIVTALPNAVNNGGRAARTAATRQGNDVGGAFARSIKSRLEVAFRSLPKADVRLGDTGFDADLARLRARMEVLSNKTIGVDVDAGAALAEISAIDAELARLGANHTDVNVRADTAAARAQLAAIQHQVNDLDRDDVRIRVHANTAEANAALLQLAVSLGLVAALPLVPIAAAGIGAIASAAVAAGAGVGALALVAIPAIKGVTSVIQAKTAAEKEAAKATDNSAAAGVKAAQSALQMVSAQQALTSAHRNAARSIAQANRQVADAERAVADAAQRAADQRRQAAENVERAERSLADAQRSARQAEEDLTQARADAAQQLKDLNDKLADGALDQRDATLRVQEAQDELNRVLMDPTATDLQIERAQLALDQATQSAKEQKKEYYELQKSAAAQQKAGVDGNADVKRATDQLATAQQNVVDQTKAVAQAHQDAARAEVAAAQTVADAQRNLSDAVASAADTQVQAAESIESAERGVESARLSSINTTSTATTKADTYRQALAKLTPAQRDLYDSIAGPKGLTKAFKDWSKELQPDVLPLFTRGVDGAKNSLPGLTPLVKNSADAIGELMDKASAQLKTPFWQGFKKDIQENAKPAIVGLGVAFGNVFKGMAGIVDAFLPHMDGISDKMQTITGRFAKWGSGLKGSPEFEGFLKYVKETGPGVAEFFGHLGDAMFKVGRALSPLSGPILDVFGTALDLLGQVADNAPWAIQLLYGLWIATRLWNLAMATSPVGLVILGLLALAVAVKYAWDHFQWFRDIVTGAWDGISGAADVAWKKVLQPTFHGIWEGLKLIGDVAVALWKDVFVPVWDGISLVVRTAIAIILTVLIAPLVIAFNGVGLLVGWLWTDCFKPTFDSIAGLASWLWTSVLSPVFGWIWDGIKWVGDQFVWLYDHAVAPSATWIGDKFTWLWQKALSPTFKWIWDGVQWVGDKFKWLYDHGVKPSADFIADKSKWLYEKGVKPAFDRMKSAVKLVGDAFGAAKKAIKSAWDAVAGIVAKPINFVIDWVYTKGIKAVWDKVAGFVGLDPLPKAPRLLDDKPKFAEGGRTYGGVPGKDSIHALLMADEFVIKRSSARKIGYGALEYMNRTGDVPRFANGGIVGALGSAWDWTRDTVGSAVSKGIDWAKTAADLVAHPSKVWNRLMKPILSKVTKNLGVADMGKVLAKFPLKIASGLKDSIVSAVTGGGGGHAVGGFQGVIPTGHRKQIITDAMEAAHVPPPGTVVQWLKGMNTLITRESGWNPRAVNNWDSNAKAGHASAGLTQTIPSTFNAYVPNALRSKGIFDPVANVAASIRYIKAVYGTITNVQQANASLPPKGYAEGGLVVPNLYDNGGYLPPGLNLVANGTGKPEPVFTGSQWADIRASKGGGGAPNVVVENHVWVGDREITEIVDHRITVRDADTGRAIDTGRWV